MTSDDIKYINDILGSSGRCNFYHNIYNLHQ